jgi:hypothetical protein
MTRRAETCQHKKLGQWIATSKASSPKHPNSNTDTNSLNATSHYYNKTPKTTVNI